ncbi:deazapurine DNA modification protein DpdA family protein [Amycolatopsis lurida]|uniref:deazapurine DNA modification protein DpdA family protein n=1 Tax=Amycolatopsis lurida TaxID=31959 RepID=UPI003666FCA3
MTMQPNDEFGALDFLTGTHEPSHLAQAGVGLFVSDTRLRHRKTLPRAIARVAYDSGGFSQLQKEGNWDSLPPRAYVARLRRYRDEIGHMLWVSPQDWMCEDAIIRGGWHGGQWFHGTKLTVPRHQYLTTVNAIELRSLAPELPWRLVLQGRTPDDYCRHADLYAKFGIDVTAEPLVCVGSVCRLQSTVLAGQILRAVRRYGVPRIHGFGFKTLGLIKHHAYIDSADSLAWSDDARRLGHPTPDCPRPHVKNCANHLHYLLSWRTALAEKLRRRLPEQTALWDEDGGPIAA